MGAAKRYVHKLIDSPAAVALTSAYDVAGRKDLTVPTGDGLEGIAGRISCIRMYGTAHDAAAKDIYVTVTFNQAGTEVWLNEHTAVITAAPIGGGTQWGATIQIEHLGRVVPADCPEGTISVFAKVNNGTATWNDCHFLWEE